MNAVRGEICGFVENDGLSLVSISTALGEFSVLMLGFSQSLNAKKGSKVELLFKENELILAKKGVQTSLDNAFESKVTSITKGKMLWQVFVEPNLSALMSAKVGEALNLSENTKVACFVRASDIIIKVL